MAEKTVVHTRRAFLGRAAAGAGALLAAGRGGAAEPGATYETHMAGMRCVPGQWRPHYPWEQIAWVSPPWASQDYIALDFPEAIFTDQGLLFLSHINPKISARFETPPLPKAPWREIEQGIAFERSLPNGVVFGGSVTRASETEAGLELYIENGSPEALTGIMLQTCAYLRLIAEFADHTADNKRVHAPGRGWVSFPEAAGLDPALGQYGYGWRERVKRPLDAPVIVTLSNKAERLVAMTWGVHTLSIVGNPKHPCMHADPFFPDIPPGERRAIQGKLAFFEGKLEDFHLPAQ